VNLAGALWRSALAGATYERVHVEGTRRLLDALHAAAKAGEPVRLVHVSTTGVLGPTGPDPKPETAEPRPSTVYERTKLEGERLALSARGPGLEVVVVRPGLVYGPRDMHLLPLFQAIDRGLFRPIAKGSALWQPVYVADVVRGLTAAMTNADLDGAVLHFAGAERLTVAAFAARIAATMGREPHGTSIPYPVAFAAGAVLEAFTAPLFADPPLSRARVRTLTQDRVYGIADAERRLGWRPEISLESGLAETIGWYRSQNLIGS
jgi:nucleoside-diphosphate-sugar epimerase